MYVCACVHVCGLPKSPKRKMEERNVGGYPQRGLLSHFKGGKEELLGAYCILGVLHKMFNSNDHLVRLILPPFEGMNILKLEKCYTTCP